MLIYFVRHAEAYPAAPGQSDAERSLTEAGLATARKLGQTLHHLGCKPPAVHTSPYLRARQTAQAIAQALQVPIVEERLLAPGCRPAALEAFLQTHAPADRVLVVGHQPDLGELIRWLTGAAVRLPPGGLAVVETPAIREVAGTLIGLYDPAWLLGAPSLG